MAFLRAISAFLAGVCVLPLSAPAQAFGSKPEEIIDTEGEPAVVLSLTDRAVRAVDRSALRPSKLEVGDDGKFQDLSLPDTRHNLSALSETYRHEFNELKVVVVNLNQSLPIFSFYKAAPDSCMLGLNSMPSDWRRVVEKLDLFTPEDDLLIFKEIAMAHEVGHCMAVKYIESINRRWNITNRELFADIFALIHVHLHMEDKKDEALGQLLRFRAGGPPDPTRPKTADLIRIETQLTERMPLAEAKDDVAAFWVEFALELMGER